MFETPILFLVFNRPDVTRRVFDRIRIVKPKRLFVVADGPRQNRPGEDLLCQETRGIVNAIDWECDLKTLFRTENLGCRQAVSSGISWFFGQVEEGIILEDDCLPDESFFPFCRELLTRYAQDRRIMHISGDNFQQGKKRGRGDYYFSIYNHVWGWATWRRAWNLYDVNMSSYESAATSKMLATLSPKRHFRLYWENVFAKTFREEIDTWDYQWTYAMWMHQGLAILPQVNLVSNIGFGADATHTQGTSWLAALPAGALNTIEAPEILERHTAADNYTSRRVFGLKIRWIEYLVWRLRSGLKIRTRLRNIFH